MKLYVSFIWEITEETRTHYVCKKLFLSLLQFNTDFSGKAYIFFQKGFKYKVGFNELQSCLNQNDLGMLRYACKGNKNKNSVTHSY